MHEVRFASNHCKKSKKNYILIFANSFNFVVCDFGLHDLRADPLLLVAPPEQGDWSSSPARCLQRCLPSSATL